MSHTTRTRLGPINEKTTARYSSVIKDEEGVAVPDTDFATFTLTLYDKKTLAIVNSRDDVSVLNANGGTIDANGNFAFIFTPDDTAILDANKRFEDRIALFEWTYGASKQGRHEVEIHIVNLNKVT